MSVLLFVMKIGFQQMDGEILKEKCNLKGAAQNGWIVAANFLPPNSGFCSS